MINNIHVVDMHTGGEPVRIIVGGFPKVYGQNIPEKRRYVRENLDPLRKLLMHEPRWPQRNVWCVTGKTRSSIG